MAWTVEKLKEEVADEIDRISPAIVQLSDRIHTNPELSLQEFKAAKWLASELEEHEFQLERGIANLETSFRATYEIVGGPPVVALLVEYDALPGLGHACGHNVSGAASIAAAIGASKVVKKHQLNGTILAMGTPGEELAAGKVSLLQAGAFSDVDVAMMAHMFNRNISAPTFLALDALEFSFKGKPAHAAGAPHMGVNALNAITLTFDGINALRQHVRDDVRIHGIITQGGEAQNIVPARASARFYVRARERSYLNKVSEKVENCARGAGLATGAELEIRKYEPNQDELITNITLINAFRENWEHFTADICESSESLGSSDIGSVSHVIPVIHPTIAIAPVGVGLHTTEFMEASASKEAHRGLLIAAKTLAMTVIDLLAVPGLLDRVRNGGPRD